MIDPYQAVGPIPTMRGIRHRDEIKTNLDHISHLIKAASWLSSLDLRRGDHLPRRTRTRTSATASTRSRTRRGRSAATAT